MDREAQKAELETSMLGQVMLLVEVVVDCLKSRNLILSCETE